jgi:hypothetical protein
MPIIWASKMERKMRQVAKTSRNFFGETFAVLGAALSVSAAVRAHRKPAVPISKPSASMARLSTRFSSKLVIVPGEAAPPRSRQIPEHPVLGGRYKLRFCWRILCV